MPNLITVMLGCVNQVILCSISWSFLFNRKRAVVSSANATTSTIPTSFPFQTTNQPGKRKTAPMNLKKPSLPSSHDDRNLFLPSSQEVPGL